MRTAASSFLAALAATLLSAGSVWGGGGACVGDCDDTGEVTVSDMVLGVNILLGSQPATACPPFQNAQGEVTVAQLVQGVNNLLNGTCNGPPMGLMRTFVIEQPVLLEPPANTATGIFTTGLSGSNAAGAISPGPLKMLLSTPDPATGIGQLTLVDDVTLEVVVVDNSRLCLQMFAEGSSGSIDCNGGTPYDILATRPSLAPGIAFDVETGLGEPAGPGNGNLLVNVLFQLVPATDSTPCDEIEYTNPIQLFGFTTTNATSVVDDTVLSLTVPGEAFDCAQFGMPGSGGQLAAPAPANQLPVGDVANVFRFGEVEP